MKIDPVPLGQSTAEGFTVNVYDTDQGQMFDWETSTVPVLAVLVKGVQHTNMSWYDYRPDGETSDTGLHACGTVEIIEPEWSDLEYISFCYIPLPEEEHEGLTPGFWKNNAEKWEAVAWEPTGYSLDQKFSDVFVRDITVNHGGGVTVDDPTLLEALSANKGDINRLARHGTAGLLNAAHPEVNYPYTVDEVIEMAEDAIDDTTKLNNIAHQLEAANELGGGVDQQGNPI